MAQMSAQQTWQPTITGTPNAMVISIPNIQSLADLKGVPIRAIAGSAPNTGPTTAAVGGTVATAIKKPSASGLIALAGGEIPGGTPAGVFELVYDGTEYVLVAGGFPTSPPPITVPRTYYVNASTGSDSNNCLTSGTACLTIQHTLSIMSMFNLSCSTSPCVTISLSGTFTTTAITLPPINGAGTVLITGNSSASVTSTSGSTFVANGVTGYTLDSMTLAATTASGGDLAAGVWEISSSITLNNITFGACQGAWAFASGGSITFSQAVTISGGLNTSVAPAAGFYEVSGIIGEFSSPFPTLTITTPVTVSIFALAISGGSEALHYASTTGASNVTGQKFNTQLNGTINTAGTGCTNLPGNSAGSNTTGGQCQ
jgi:hypothetical protein